MAVLVGSWWYWVSKGRYWFIVGGTVSVYGDTGQYHVLFWRVLFVRALSFSFILNVESFRVFLYINCWELCHFYFIYICLRHFYCWERDLSFYVGTFYCWEVWEALLGDLESISPEGNHMLHFRYPKNPTNQSQPITQLVFFMSLSVLKCLWMSFFLLI